MIQTKITWQGKKVRLGGYGFTKYQMLQLGQFGLNDLKARVERGLGADDSKMKPLNRGYAIQKTKAGKGNVRNMLFTGAMLDNLSIRYADAQQVKISLTARLQRVKASANEKLQPWLQWSDSNQKKIIEKAQESFKQNVEQFQKAVRSFRK